MSEEAKKTIRIRIQNSGTYGYDTKITDAETGVEIENVASLTWSYDCNGSPFERLPKATLTVFHPVIDIIVDAELRKICPVCGRDVEDEHVLCQYEPTLVAST